MPTANCKPLSGDALATSYPAWALLGATATSKVAAVTTQGDGGYIQVRDDQASTIADYTSHDFSGVPSGATINSVSIYWVQKKYGNPVGKIRWNCKLGASTTNGAWQRISNAKIEAIAKPGGGSWAYADLASIKINFECDGLGDGTAEQWVDQYYLVVDYTGGGGLSGFVGYTGASTAAVAVGATAAWVASFTTDTGYPGYAISAADGFEKYWRVAVSTDTTFSAPAYSGTVTFTPAGASTRAPFGAWAKVTSLNTNTTYYYRSQVATDTATWVYSEDTYQSFATLTASQTIAVQTFTATYTPDTIAPTYGSVDAVLTNWSRMYEYEFDLGNGFTWKEVRKPPQVVSSANWPRAVKSVLATNSTYTITGTFTALETTVSSTGTVVVAAPTVTATYTISSTTDTSGPVQKVKVALQDLSSKVKSTALTTRSLAPYDPLEQRLWTITKPSAVTETFTGNPLEVTYGTEVTDVGYYGVSLSVTSVYGFSSSTSSTQAFAVAYKTPAASFEAISPRYGKVPLEVSFKSSSVGQITTAVWNFGDTATSATTAATVTHSYVTPGAYTVTLTVTGSVLGGSATSSQERTGYVVALDTTATRNAGNLVANLAWATLEDPYSNPCDEFEVFGGFSEVLACLNRRLRHFFHATEVVVTETDLGVPTAGVYPLPADCLKLKRVRVGGVAVQPLEQKQADLFQSAWQITTATTGDVVGYIWQPEGNQTLQLVPKYSGPAVVVDYVAAPTAITEGPDCFDWAELPLPYALAWGIRWGVLADLFSKEGEMNDPVRAKFAEEMYQLSVDLAKMLITRRTS